MGEEDRFLPAGAPTDPVSLWGETYSLIFLSEIGIAYSEPYPVTWDVSRVNWDTPGGIRQIEGLADEVTYRFYLEVWGGLLQGTSNTLEFYADSDDRQGGGEWKDGEDATLPPVTDPPPENGGDPGTGDTATGRGTTPRGDGSEEEPADTTGPDDPVAADKPQGNPEPPASQQPDSGQSDPADRQIDVALPAIAAARTEAPGYPEGAQVWKRERLAMLARDNPEQVSFHAGTLRAYLPTAPLLEAVGNGDFAVLLEQPGPDGFRIALYADGTELEGLGGAPFRVLAPAPDIGGMLNGLDEAGGKTAVELEGNQAIATLTRTGTYTLASNTSGILLLTAEEQEGMPESESTNTAQGNTPALGWIAMTVAAAIAMGSAALLFIRWRCRRDNLRRRWAGPLLLVLAVACSAAIFQWQFLHDNKYTAPRPQGAGGTVWLEDSAAWADPGLLLHLVDGWEVCRDRLLTPRRSPSRPRTGPCTWASTSD